MKASYMLPSGTYNLILSPDDLQILLCTGRLTVGRVAYEIPCVTGRARWDKENNVMKYSEKQDVINDLRFMLHEPVDDIEPGPNNIQFLNIIIDKGDSK